MLRFSIAGALLATFVVAGLVAWKQRTAPPSPFDFLTRLHPFIEPPMLIQATGMATTGRTQTLQFRQPSPEVLEFLKQELVVRRRWTVRERKDHASFEDPADPHDVFLIFDKGTGGPYESGYCCSALTNMPASWLETQIGPS